MARNKRLKTVSSGMDMWAVVDRSSGETYATLYLQNYGGYRVRLANYPHRLSKTFGSEDQALAHVEREVF